MSVATPCTLALPTSDHGPAKPASLASANVKDVDVIDAALDSSATSATAVTVADQSGSQLTYKFRGSDFHPESWREIENPESILSAFQWCEDHLAPNKRELLIDLAAAYDMRSPQFIEWLKVHGSSQESAGSRFSSYHGWPLGAEQRSTPPREQLWTLALEHQWLPPSKPSIEIEAKKDEKSVKLVAPTEAKKTTNFGPTRFRLQSPTELINAPTPPWLIQGVLPANGLGALYGPPASGKTFLLLDLCFAVASGRPWFGHFVKAPAPVFYVAQEGQGALVQRIRAWRTEHSDTPLPERPSFLTDPFNLRVSSDVNDLCKVVLAAGGEGALIVIDTLSRAAAGADENSASDMGELIAACTNIQRKTGGMVLVVHHSGKTEGKGLRGHSSLNGAVDCAIEISRTADYREWILTKARDSSDGLRNRFKLKPVSLGADESGQALTSCVVEPMDGPAPVPMKKLPSALQQLKPIFNELSKAQDDGGGVRFGELCKIAKIKYGDLHPGKVFRKDNFQRAYAKHFNVDKPSEDTFVNF
ncbi:helicase RepA family protein [Cupriavidus pinatubonensis]|uniref:helicase RepA family protein n=1 Tax=Cupriavidus pinatubonensis TaxID=248026 RepID=UPI0015E43B97|nr:helicase RepA family protein [Cupriavidus pinatubonensis]